MILKVNFDFKFKKRFTMSFVVSKIHGSKWVTIHNLIRINLKKLSQGVS